MLHSFDRELSYTLQDMTVKCLPFFDCMIEKSSFEILF